MKILHGTAANAIATLIIDGISCDGMQYQVGNKGITDARIDPEHYDAFLTEDRNQRQYTRPLKGRADLPVCVPNYSDFLFIEYIQKLKKQHITWS